MQIYGIDLSMEKFDVNYIDEKGKKRNKSIKNKLIDISDFLETVPDNVVLCAENTGPYGDLLVFLSNHTGVKIALVSGYTIRHSFGMIKGKSDAIDAERIREYGERFTDKLIFKQYDTEEVFELKSLYSFRSQLVRACKILQNGKHSRTNTPMQSISVKKHTDKALENLNAEIGKVKAEIETIIKNNKEYRLYYQKKQLEGKPHYLIMNNVSNKMLRTIYSIVINKRPYSQEHICFDPRELKNINNSDEKVA